MFWLFRCYITINCITMLSVTTPLTDTQIKTAKPTTKNGKLIDATLSDGNGLYLHGFHHINILRDIDGLYIT